MARQSGISYEEVIRELKSKMYKPIYFLHGDEPYYIDLVSDYIQKNVLSEAEQSFNQTVVYGKDSNAADVVNLARRFPMMAPHQVVIVREAQELDDLEVMIPYFENPQPSTLLVFCYKYKKPDGRKKVFQSLRKASVWMETKKLYEDKIPGWISSYASAKKYRVEPKASALLAEFLGSDLAKIANELDKLFVAAGEGERNITPELVERNIGISKDYNVFELQKALGTRDVLKVNRIVRYFAANEKAYPIQMTIGILHSYFSKLLLFHYAPDKSDQGLVSTLKLGHPFFLKEYKVAARNYPAGKLVNVISLLREYDMRSKGFEGTTPPGGELLKELCFKIVH